MAGKDYFVVEYVHGCSLECNVKIETPGVSQKFVVQNFVRVGNGVDQKHLPLNGKVSGEFNAKTEIAQEFPVVFGKSTAVASIIVVIIIATGVVIFPKFPAIVEIVINPGVKGFAHVNAQADIGTDYIRNTETECQGDFCHDVMVLNRNVMAVIV